MFIQNKYTKIYYQIINRAKNRAVVDGYSEKHHIVPTCIGGENTTENIIRLTAREHYICHHLLTKMNPSSGLKYAFILMMVNNPHQQRNFKITAKMYEISKRINSELASARFTGKQTHNVGKKKWHDPSTQEEFFAHIGDELPSWKRGFSQNTKNKMEGKHVGKIYYYNPVTLDVINLHKDVHPPTGYVKGNPNANTGHTCLGKKNFYNPITGDSTKTHSCPDGYVSGAVKVWVTNGIDNKMVNRVTHIFDENWIGWRLGRTFNAHKGK